MQHPANMAAPALTLRFLGGFHLEVAGEVVSNVPRAVQQILAILALEGEVDRNLLADTIWPDADAERSRFYLRRSLSQLRTALGVERDRLVAKGEGKMEFGESGMWCDVREFQKALESEDLSRVEQGVSLYAGPFLSGVRLDWARSRRHSLRAEYIHGLMRLSEAARERKEFVQATVWLQKALAEEPTREETARQLMSLYAELGQFAEIVRTVRDVRHRVRHQLNLPLSQETAKLYRELMERAQLIDATQRTETPLSGPPISIPAAVSPFWGRERELDALLTSILQHRLVTLTGFGGVGKTRMALRAASELGESFDQISFADLSSCVTGQDVGRQVAKSLALPEVGLGDIADAVAERLGSARCLLIVDGAEQFVSETASLLETLLPRCAHLHVLCTSRILLSLPEEDVVSLVPLETPGTGMSEEEANRTDAIGYFLSKAQHAAPGFKATKENGPVVAEICRRLDGLPLALELAAVRLRSMPAEEILAGLDDRFRFLERASTSSVRHRTLEAVLDLSWKLLSEEESILFSRLGTFPASFSARAAQAVCGGEGLSAGQIPILIGNLVDQSLVEYHPESVDGRYRLLETVRTYSRDRLSESELGVEAFEDRHSEYYYQIASDFDGDPTCAERFKLNEPNFAHALERLTSDEDRSRRLMAVGLANRLFPYWTSSGNLSEGITTALKAIEACGSGADDALAECYLRTAGAAHVLYELSLADELFEKAFMMSEMLGLDSWSAEALRGQGEVASNYGKPDRSAQLLTAAYDRAVQLNDEICQASCLGMLGYVARTQFRLDEARNLTNEALALYTQTGNQDGRLWCMGSLAAVHLAAKQPALALPLLHETLAHWERLDNKSAIAWNHTCIGSSHMLQGDLDRAEAHLRLALDARNFGDRDATKSWPLLELGSVLRRKGKLDEAEGCVHQSLELCRSTGSLEARALIEMAWIFLDRGDLTTARVYQGMARKIAAELQSVQLQHDFEDFESGLASKVNRGTSA